MILASMLSKTKLIIVSRQSYENAILYIINQPFDNKFINKFKYLDSTQIGVNI